MKKQLDSISMFEKMEIKAQVLSQICGGKDRMTTSGGGFCGQPSRKGMYDIHHDNDNDGKISAGDTVSYHKAAQA